MHTRGRENQEGGARKHRRRCNHSQFEDLQSSVGACSVHRVGGAWEESSQGGGRLATAQLEGGHKFVSPCLLLWGSHFVRFSTVFSTLIDSNLFPMVPMLSSAARMPFPGAARAFWECSAEVSHSTQGQSEIVRLDEFSARGSMQKSRERMRTVAAR